MSAVQGAGVACPVDHAAVLHRMLAECGEPRESGAAHVLVMWRDRVAALRAAAAALAVLPVATPDAGWRPTHRHVNRGTEYEVVGQGIMQAPPAGSQDEASVTVYRDHDGKLWVRETAEFNDGRFEVLP